MPQDEEHQLYDKYLDALAEHTNVAAELRALELRHLETQNDSSSFIAERASLQRNKQEAIQQYLDARKAYEDYRRSKVEEDQ